MSAPIDVVRDVRRPVLVIAIVAQLALLGLAVGLWSVIRSNSSPVASAAPSTGYRIAEPVPASFGPVVVGTAQTLPGLSQALLAGQAGHGIAGYVPPDKVQVQVTVEVTNRQKVPVDISPDQFRLVGSNGQSLELTGSSIRDMTLQPDAAVEATLIYVAPRKGQKLRLAFHDRGRPEPFLIELGRVDKTPAGAANEATHGHTP